MKDNNVIKLKKFYCQNDNGAKVRCWYSYGKLIDGRACVTIYAKEYGKQLSNVFDADRVSNETEIMTDYFEKDKVRIFEDDKLWEAAFNLVCGKSI